MTLLKIALLCTLRFVAFSKQKLRCALKPKKLVAKVALRFYFCKTSIVEVALRFMQLKNGIAEVAQRFIQLKNWIAKVALRFDLFKNQIASCVAFHCF